RQALSFVEAGAAEAGIVYATDAAVSKRVEIATRVDPALCDPIRYPIVLLSKGARNPAARQFFEHLAVDEAATVFRKFGFTVLECQQTFHTTTKGEAMKTRRILWSVGPVIVLTLGLFAAAAHPQAQGRSKVSVEQHLKQIELKVAF